MTSQGRTLLSTVQHALYPELTEHSLIFLWLKARDFHCYSHVADNPGERSIPSDHVADRIVVQKPTNRCDQVRRIPSWMSTVTILSSILTKISDDHQYPADPFAALAEFNQGNLREAGKQTHHELLRNTPSSLGAQLLIASTALRAYRNRHLDTLMHCCEAWRSVGKCFDQYSFECVDFHGLSQIIASLTRERIAEREADIHSLPWTQTEKDNALTKCRLGLRAWRTRKPTLCLHAITNEDGHPLENEDESGMRLCAYWCEIFEARVEGERHHCHETILQYVQTAPDDTTVAN